MNNRERRAVSRKVAALAVVLLVGVGAVSYGLLLRGEAGQSSTQNNPLGQSVTTSVTSSGSEGSSSSAPYTETSSLSASTPAQSQTSSTTYSSSSTSPASGAISHVVVVLMENEEYGSVIGSPSAPYQNSLASTYALAADYTGVAHPSLPNYLALVAGSTFGVTSDCSPAQCSVPSSTTSVATLLDAHGLTWKEYAESMPAPCSQTDSPDGLYVTKHDPFVYFDAITGNTGTGATSAYCNSHVASMTQFYSDLQAGSLPSYSFITPNTCDDAHSCALAAGDTWLSTFVPKIVNSSSFSSTALFIVYDEGSPNDLTGGGGQVPCILVSPFAKPGYVSHATYSHYSLLATVEAIFGLGNLGRNDATASPMSDMFVARALPTP